MRFPLAIAAAALIVSAPALAALKTGHKAPEFTAAGALAGQPFDVDLDQLRKKGPVVLYFFPAAFTPGCNAEAAAFAQEMGKFHAAGATVIGMTRGNTDQLAAFSRKHCSDKFAVAAATPQVAREYDVTRVGKDGTVSPYTTRTSYVIAPNGRIIYAHTSPEPAGHITGTLAAVRAWRAAHPRR